MIHKYVVVGLEDCINKVYYNTEVDIESKFYPMARYMLYYRRLAYCDISGRWDLMEVYEVQA